MRRSFEGGGCMLDDGGHGSWYLMFHGTGASVVQSQIREDTITRKRREFEGKYSKVYTLQEIREFLKAITRI